MRMRWSGAVGLCAGRLVLAGAFVLLAGPAARAEEEPPEIPDAQLGAISKQFDVGRMKRLVERMSALGSRAPGYPGNAKAVEMLLEEFRRPELGLTDVGTQRFELPMPIDRGSHLVVGPPDGPTRRIKLEPVWPNLVRTSTCRVPDSDDGKARAPLIYVASGELANYNGLDVWGAVVLMDFNSGVRWLDAVNLGAKAVIFIEPEAALRGEASEKHLRAPLNMPRFWVDRETGRALVEECKRATGRALECRLASQVVWERVIAENVYGILKGTEGPPTKEPKKGEEGQELIIFGSHLDSVSTVPSLAPGAEGATGAAMLLELARIYAKNPPKKDTVFLLTNAHYMNLKGMRFFYDIIHTEVEDHEKAIETLQTEAGNSRAMAWVVEHRDELGTQTSQDKLRSIALKIVEDQGGLDKHPSVHLRGYYLVTKLVAACLLLICLGIYWLLKRQREPSGGDEALAQEADAQESDGGPESESAPPDTDTVSADTGAGGVSVPVVAVAVGLVFALLLWGALSYVMHSEEARKKSVISEFVQRVVEDTDEDLAKWVGDKAARVEDRLRVLRLIGERTPEQEAERKERADRLQLLWRVKDRIRGFSRYLELKKKDPERKKIVDRIYGEMRSQLAGELERAAKNFDAQRAVAEHNRRCRALFSVKKSEGDEVEYVNRYRRVFYMGLDMSSRSDKSGLLFKGMYYNQSTKNMERLFSEIGEQANLHARRVEGVLGYTEGTALVDAIRKVKGWAWDTFIPESGKIGLDVEIANHAGENGRIPWKGLAVVPVHDSRLFVDTPHDTVERVNWDNLEYQGRFLAPFLRLFLDDPEIWKPIALTDNTVGPVTVSGDVVRKGGARSVFADRPVPGALVVRIKRDKAFMGVRANDVVITDRHGRYALTGTRNRSRCDIEVYALDEKTGRITHAHDKGQTSTAATSTFFVRVYAGKKTGRIPVFRCDTLAMLDLVDQRFLTQLSNFTLIDARSESTPQAYGAARPVLGEPVIIIFGKPNSRVKIIISKGQLGVRMALLNIDPKKLGKDRKLKDLKGAGFPVSEMDVIPYSSYRAARDMFLLDDWRISKLVEHSIENKRLHCPEYVKAVKEGEKLSELDLRPGLHDLTDSYLKEAEVALDAKQYSVFIEKARSAWATESRAYPDVRGTQDDTVVGVIFYLFLVLPFCFFVERLIFGFVKIEHQILGFFGIFTAIFAILRLVHPAFALTKAPTMVLLAFIILALSILVIGIVYGKFSTELRALRDTRRTAGQSAADVNRLSASAVAVSLGISNMRRRKIRTFLTTATIVILTFTALSFTSVITSIRKPRVELDVTPAYEGMVIKDQAWAKLDEPVYRILRNRYNKLGTVVSPRAWYLSEDVNKQTKISVVNPDDESHVYTALGALGLGPDEPRVFAPDPETGFTGLEGALYEGGEWFKSDTGLEVILSDDAIEKLGFEPETAAGKTVKFLGAEFTIVGVVDTEKFDLIKDINNEQITPVDYLAQDQPSGPGQGSGAISRQMALIDAELGKTYEHLSASRMVIIPYKTAMGLGGTLRSVAVRFGPEENATGAVADLLGRMEINFYAAVEGRSFLYASVGGKSLSGLKNLIIPILIASLIIFNTMVGSVYERNREIHIFSSLGLAPGHIASLFLTESVVYATLGAMSGYVIGQAVAKSLTAFDLLQGLTLNYSSISTVSTTMIVMAAVVGSTIYPAIQASRVAVPSAERRWAVPEPRGDEITIELPFTFSLEHLLGINQFMFEFFSAHVESTIGKFYAREISMDVVKGRLGEGYCLYFMAWLTPYDLGVSQEVQIYTVPTEEGNYIVEISLYRASGYVSSWVRTNGPFLNTLRKQFLMWRTLTNEQRDGLQADGKENLLKTSSREVEVPEHFKARVAAGGEAADAPSGGGEGGQDD